MAKTIKELSFDNLFMEYKIFTRIDKENVDEMFAKLFGELVTKCANELYEGDKENIDLHKALYNNLVADKRTRFNNPDRYFNGYLPEKNLKLQLVDLLDTLLPRELRIIKKERSGDTKADKSYWEYNEEDILEVTDEAILNSIYNNMSSAMSKETMLANAAKSFDMSVEEAKERLRALRTLAREQKAKLNKPQLSDDLLAKLQGGKKAVLSAAEVEELRKLLG